MFHLQVAALLYSETVLIFFHFLQISFSTSLIGRWKTFHSFLDTMKQENSEKDKLFYYSRLQIQH